MALEEAPPFWWENPGWQALLLAPFGFLYGQVSAKRMSFSPSMSADVPVLCIGNFITGGAGKTPTAISLAKQIRKRGYRPGILSRGWGGSVNNPTVVKPDRHNAHDVGDEALLHAANAVTVVASDRPAGAQLLLEQGCDFIIMDDGFQNPSLEKDYNLVVVDAKRGLGNGFTMPAGPLRVPFRDQLRHADCLLVIGEGERGDKIIRKAARSGKPVFSGQLAVIGKTKFKDMDVFAYAGIGDPDKFFETLESVDANIKVRLPYGDHHPFTDEECRDMVQQSKRQKLQLVTTTKDLARLRGMGKEQEKLLAASLPLHAELRLDDPAMLDRVIDDTVARYEKRTLTKSNYSK